MENNNLLVEKYNKIWNLQSISDPKIFSRISLLKKVCQYPNVTQFQGHNKSGQDIRVYFSTKQVRDFDTNIIYLSSSPFLILIKGTPENMIIESGVTEKLENWLYKNQLNKRVPYIQQMDARKLIIQLNQSASNFKSRSLIYDCFSLKNIVKNSTNQKWQLSLAAYLLGFDQDNPDFFHKTIKNEHKMAFSMACLLFKLIYGFSPIPSNPSLFDGSINQLQYLKSQQSQQKRRLKTYFFCERNPLISKSCKKLLSDALKGMSWDSWLNHEYFKPEFEEIKQKEDEQSTVNRDNAFLRMTNNADPANYSLIVAAINHRESHPYEMLNKKPQVEEYQRGDVQHLKNHPVYCNIDFQKLVQKNEQSQSDEKNSKVRKLSNGKYFNDIQFDPEDSFPCRELIKLIQKQKNAQPSKFKDEEYESKIKLHSYPYALGYELLKVAEKQPVAIQDKISHAFDLLMKLSSFNKISQIPPLTKIEPNFKSFEEVKPQLRSTLNDLYEHFMNEAMRKYNLKVDNFRQDIIEIRKREGLEYYRLCLKLLEGSLLMRKKGKDLNLNRIQTNSRKQIQSDITNLLETYFPQRPEIH